MKRGWPTSFTTRWGQRFHGLADRSTPGIIGNLFVALKNHLRARPALGRVILAPSDVKLDDGNVFEPDLYFVSAERAGIFTDQGTTGAPDLVVEVLSLSTLRLDREKKRAIYFRAGVRELWFVLPERRRLELHLPGTTRGKPRARWGLGNCWTRHCCRAGRWRSGMCSVEKRRGSRKKAA